MITRTGLAYRCGKPPRLFTFPPYSIARAEGRTLIELRDARLLTTNPFAPTILHTSPFFMFKRTYHSSDSVCTHYESWAACEFRAWRGEKVAETN